MKTEDEKEYYNIIIKKGDGGINPHTSEEEVLSAQDR